jgi:hypothetical protein
LTQAETALAAAFFMAGLRAGDITHVPSSAELSDLIVEQTDKELALEAARIAGCLSSGRLAKLSDDVKNMLDGRDPEDLLEQGDDVGSSRLVPPESPGEDGL